MCSNNTYAITHYYDMFLTRCDNANYTLLVPSQVHAGKTLTSLLTVHYSTSGSVQVSIDLYKTSDLRTSLLPLTKEVTSELSFVY